jgi:hypothetical protein
VKVGKQLQKIERSSPVSAFGGYLWLIFSVIGFFIAEVCSPVGAAEGCEWVSPDSPPSQPSAPPDENFSSRAERPQ